MSERQVNLMKSLPTLKKLWHFTTFITGDFNNTNEKFIFREHSKPADIRIVPENDWRNEKEKYRPVIVLPNNPKTCESSIKMVGNGTFCS